MKKLQDANKLNRTIYTNYYDHQIKLSEAMSKITVNNETTFDRQNLNVIFSACENATIVQR